MPQDPFVEGDMTNAEFRAALMNLTQLLTAQFHVVNNHFIDQSNQGVGPQPNASTSISRIRDILTMNLPTFDGTNMDEDPQGFVDEVFKVVNAMGVNPREKAELAS